MFALHVAEDNSDGYLSDEEPESTQGMDHLKLGDQYQILLEKRDGSLGLNVTVSK